MCTVILLVGLLYLQTGHKRVPLGALSLSFARSAESDYFLLFMTVWYVLELYFIDAYGKEGEVKVAEHFVEFVI